jgi:hypothetical protein
MVNSVRLRRLITTTITCAAVVLGLSVLLGSGRAQATSQPTHKCSITDKHFIDTVKSNMTQLVYWSEALTSGDAAPGVVIKQALAESRQVAATGPTDLTLVASRSLLRKMFVEYAGAVKAKALGASPGVHVRNAYTLANHVHDLLVAAQPGLLAQGCDVTPLLLES